VYLQAGRSRRQAQQNEMQARGGLWIFQARHAVSFVMYKSRELIWGLVREYVD
jgi:hypothetical protein